MESLSRPIPPRSPVERLRTWLVWFGVGRLVAASVATIVVCAGAVWLVRTSPLATEASLPRAVGTTIATGSSVPVERTEPEVTTPSTEPVVLVHVAGAVVEPGVYQLVGDTRVRDAIVAAGGPTPTADWDALNLAASISDGVRVYVPSLGEELAPSLALAPGDPAGTIPTGPIDVNAATTDELESLPGIGPATALAIVTERERNGPFVDVDDLDRVPGIGPAKLEALRGLVAT